MKEPVARERGASVSSLSSNSSTSFPTSASTSLSSETLLIECFGCLLCQVVNSSQVLVRPTVDAVLLVLVLPLILLIVVLLPWGDFDLSSPHLQLLGIALTFASVLLCLKMACLACSYSGEEDPVSRRNSQQGLLSSIEDGPPNYESIMAADPGQNSRWILAIVPAALHAQTEPPPYHAVIVEPEGQDLRVHQDEPQNTPV